MSYKQPFVKVVWEDTPENFTSQQIKRVKTHFQRKLNTKNVKVITKSILTQDGVSLNSLDISDNILDKHYQKKLILDFINENKINISLDLLNKLDNRVNGEIDKQNEKKIRYNKWEIKKINFSNFLSYGEDNELNFNDLNGITVIESRPQNFGGKTTLCDLFLFLFFGTTSKTKTNSEIFNRFTDLDEVKVVGELKIDETDYIIDRRLIRKKTKGGDYNVTSKLEYSRRKDDGTIENLNGEQRKETEIFITSAIGTEEDFLSTILTTGYNLEELIESKPTMRGQILTKFIGLERLKEKEDIAKKLFNDWSKKLISNTNNIKQLEINNNICHDSFNDSSEQIIKLDIDLSKVKKELLENEEKRETLLKLRNSEVDMELLNTNPTQLQLEINTLIKKQQQLEEEIEKIIVLEPSEYYLESDHVLWGTLLTKINLDKLIAEEHLKQCIDLLDNLVNGTICPTCKRSLADVDHNEEIMELNNKINIIKEQILKLQTEYDDKFLKETHFRKLKDELNLYEKNKLIKTKYELEISQKKLEISQKEARLKNYDSNKIKLEENKKIDFECTVLKTKIETNNANIGLINNTIEKHKNNMQNMVEKIEYNKELIKKINTEEELINVFKIYFMVFGKNGISKIILKNMVPLINQELYRLLIDSCNFLLELNVNDKNEVEFIMIDIETRVIKPLYSGSGYERTIASLALRSVLTKISTLPKPNVVIMDEVFGKIADVNLEMVGEFFQKIKNYFDYILIISHNPLFRNWSDNLIMVNKDENNISAIDYIHHQQ